MKYLGIRIDSELIWKAQIDDIAPKLIRANGMLYKVRDFANAAVLKAIFHVLFETHIHYTCVTYIICTYLYKIYV